ncbi:hypothetical protein F5X68DRAFT_206871 [Plectosphaerella plurivora]|uniref:Uncharacterized protein n=1 Tax=Plectosphaerella plurivora TaxID=936078 RepID=A0A9P8VCE7_9PEZI|nr:hypothetical protein F5X68DRAFT_206871 [Plectosphaerella plurivora]
MPTLRRSAKRDVVQEILNVDDSARAIEPVATNLESIITNPDDGHIEALGVVNDAQGKRESKGKELAKAAVAAVDAPVAKRSKLPAGVQFPLLSLISFSISSLLYSFLNEWTGSELANVGKSLDSWVEVGVLASWRITELALGWFGNFDSLDLAGLNLLAHGPTMYLLSTFYNISAPTAIAAVAIEMASTFIPFQLLRPLSGVHAGAKGVANREIVTDVPIAIYTTLLSTIIYSITIFTAMHLTVPQALVLYFQDIPSVEPAYTANYVGILPVMLAFGFAARSFIFTPFAATGPTTEDRKLDEFDPVTATLGETLLWNLWGYTTRAKVIISRTLVAIVVTGVNTYLQTYITVPGVESAGAASWASTWAVAVSLVGIALALVGGEE